MIELTKEFRALKNSNGLIDIAAPRDIHINESNIILMETTRHSWGEATHIMLMAGGTPISFVVKESPAEIKEKIKVASF
jgi:hypothetical protein